jgi:hypothetical protein
MHLCNAESFNFDRAAYEKLDNIVQPFFHTGNAKIWLPTLFSISRYRLWINLMGRATPNIPLDKRLAGSQRYPGSSG